MKQNLANGFHWLAKSRGLPLVALAVLGLVTVMPGWVRAQSETTTTFTSPLPGGPHGEHGGPHDEIRALLDSIIDRDEILAEVLGMTVEELAAAKEAGTSIDALVAEAGLDKETVRTAMQTAITEAVEQAVTDGTITQEQADLILTPPAPPQNAGKPEHGHHGPGAGDHAPRATPTPTLIATAPADGTPAATATAEATPTADATTVGTAETNSANDNGDRPRPHHDQPPAQNSDASSSTTTSSSDSTASTTSSESSTSSDTASSTSDNTAATNQQPASDHPAHGGGHQRPGR